MKPQQIIALEKHYNIELFLLKEGNIMDDDNLNTYLLNDKNEIVALNLCDRIVDCSF